MTASWKTQGVPDGPMTDTHRAALAEWSRLLATGALPESADEQTVAVGPTVLLQGRTPWKDYGGYPGPGIGGRPYARRRETRRQRLTRLVRWLVRLVGALALTALVLLYLLLWGIWAGLRARPRPALVALGLVAVALVAGWVVGR